MIQLSEIFQAARPKTLPAAVVPVWLGCILVYSSAGIFHSWLAISTLMGAICIQVATNFFNDAIDADKGADTAERIGPERVTSSGKMSRKQVYGWAFLFLAVATCFGVHLISARGWMVALIGLPSLYLSFGYTGGPVPLAYRGLGELFVIVFFGWIAVMGTVFIQTGQWTFASFLLGTQVGLLSAVLILVNNIRDREEDGKTGKNTLSVIWGAGNALRLLFGFTFIFYLLVIYWWWVERSAIYLLPYASLPLAIGICAGVKKQVSSGSSGYNKYLALSALHLLLFATLWTLAALFSE